MKFRQARQVEYQRKIEDVIDANCRLYQNPNINIEEEIKRIIKINTLFSLGENDVIEMLRDSKAIFFKGHFQLLTFELHTDQFFRFASIAQYPKFIAQISTEMISWIKQQDIGNIDVVLGPTSAGMFFAYDVAKALYKSKMETRAVYASYNPDAGVIEEKLVDGFEIKTGEDVLIVNDMTTTGKGLKTLCNIVQKNKGNIIGICIFAKRDNGQFQLVKELMSKYRFRFIVDLKMNQWKKTECKLCKDNIPFVYSKDLQGID